MNIKNNICSKCHGNGFIKIRGYDLEVATINCPKCTVDGKRDYLKRTKKNKPSVFKGISTKFQLTYQPILNPIFFG